MVPASNRTDKSQAPLQPPAFPECVSESGISLVAPSCTIPLEPLASSVVSPTLPGSHGANYQSRTHCCVSYLGPDTRTRRVVTFLGRSLLKRAKGSESDIPSKGHDRTRDLQMSPRCLPLTRGSQGFVRHVSLSGGVPTERGSGCLTLTLAVDTCLKRVGRTHSLQHR